MRCTECDRPASPQSVGYSPSGKLVFGWCEECMQIEGCEFFEVEASAIPFLARASALGSARPPRSASSSQRPERRAPASRPRMNTARTISTRNEDWPLRERLALLRHGSIALGVWAGVMLTLALVFLITRRPEVLENPMPNGKPVLLAVGGAFVGLMSLALWSAARPERFERLAAPSLGGHPPAWGGNDGPIRGYCEGSTDTCLRPPPPRIR